MTLNPNTTMTPKTPLKNLGSTVLAGALAGVLPAASASAQEAPTPTPPNIVLILADDLGYGDLGCYNPDSKVPTPNLDRLASQGIRFTNAYCPDAVCSPSRYALMTGRYALRARESGGVLSNWQPPAIEDGTLTLPQLLKQAGYVTGGFAKWHLGATYKTTDGRKPIGQNKFTGGTGGNLDLSAPINDGPTDRGFDRWYGFVCASETLIFDQDRAVAYLKSNYEPPTAAGVSELQPIPLPDYLPLTAGKAMEFIRERAPDAKAGKPFFAAFFAYVPHVPLAVADDFRGKTQGGDYGDYVHELDHYVGQVLLTLDETGLADNTLVLFASDNGSQFDKTGDHGHRPNGKLRGGKYDSYEGGVRTPFIARWPGHVPAGATSEKLIALTDLMATCAALTGQTIPEGAAEDSVNMLPTLLGKDAPGREFVINRSNRNRLAIREGDWKYHTPHGDAPAELYNLKTDPAERKNVADQHPDIAARLKTRLDETIAGTPGQKANAALRNPGSGK